MNKWEAKFGWFWYNDEELFQFEQKDFDKKAKKMADSGINIVITFSCTHFRWTFHRYWDKILKCLKMVVKACHKYDIKVVEHASSHLTFNPQNQEERDYMERVLNKRESTIDSWEGLAEHVNDEIYENGFAVSSFRQIDGRTGEHARSSYKGYCMCFNNPDFIDTYLKYLEKVYETGVDGIMTDDVQYFGEGHACACKHCKKLYKEETGYDLPKPGKQWEKFYGDYENLKYIAWERFRRKSTKRFHQKVNEHFRSLGLDLLRPNYVSAAINSNPTAYCFHEGAELWDWIFKENCFSTLIRYSWPQWYVENLHRYALAERNNVPSMSMFYPDREDSYYFVWALANSWGQMVTCTPEGRDLSSVEKKYRMHEKKYNNVFNAQKKCSQTAIMFSLDTAYYIKDQTHRQNIFGWGEGMYLSNISADMVFPTDDVKKLSEYKMIILPDVRMLSDDQIKKLKDYAKNGGKLFITGMPGIKNTDGKYRSKEQIVDMFGLKQIPQKCEPSPNSQFVIGKQKIELDGQQPEFVFEDCDNGFAFCENQTVGIWQEIKDGKIYWIPGSINLTFYNGLRADRWQDSEQRVICEEYKTDFLKNVTEIVKSIHKDDNVIFKNIPDEWVITYFKSSNDKNLHIHIVNTEGVMPKTLTEVGHSDVIPTFKKDYSLSYDGSGKLIVNSKFNVSEVTLITPESDKEIQIPMTKKDNGYEINIPKEVFNSYATIICKE